MAIFKIHPKLPKQGIFGFKFEISFLCIFPFFHFVKFEGGDFHNFVKEQVRPLPPLCYFIPDL